MTINSVFFELLQVALGNRDSLSINLSAKGWEKVLDMCIDQTLLGVGYVGFQKLPHEQWPKERMLIAQWTILAEKLKEQNEGVNRDCVAVCELLKKEGFHSCILKGQSNLRHYGEIGMYRTSGDIDVWAWSDSGKVKEVIRFVQKRKPNAELTYHHADCNLVGETETEVHHRPSWMSTPWRNKVLQNFCESHKGDVLPYEGFYIPSVEFDVVYQLVHIYRHLFYEGIGLRQIVDYYYVLESLCADKSNAEEKKREAMAVIDRLGMRKFCGAVMYVLREVFAMSEQNLLCQPNEKEGKVLLDEIMLAGNFGHSDERLTVTKEENRAKWGVMKLARNMKFISSYPEEVIFEPIFRIVHWCWRTFKLYEI